MNTLGAHPALNQRTPGASSDGSAPGPSHPDSLRPPAANAKAEKFEDEKRRIISSCFSRRDESGKLMQSYITHVKVEEDAAYQSTPPPPGSSPQYKKPRAIIVAVKSTGRVGMHKARENDDGTFQIGKSWPLDELQSIESFSNSLPKTPEQQQAADWAGPMGFVINMSKPYYWQAKSSKEKEFFIGSLVKIYNKFTGGKLPGLIGFDEKDKESIIASTRSQGARQTPRGPPPGPQISTTSPRPAAATPLSPGVNSDLSSLVPPDAEPSTPRFAPPDRPFVGEARRPSSNSSGQDSRTTSTQSTEFLPPSPYKPSQPPVGGPRPQQQPRPPGAPPGGPPGPPGTASPRYPTPPASRNGTPQLRQRPSREQGLRQPSPYQAYSRGPASPGPSRLTPQSSRPNMRDRNPSQTPSAASSVTPVASPRRPSSPSRKLDPNGNARALSPASTDTANVPPMSLGSSTTDRWKPATNDTDHTNSEASRATSEAPFKTADSTHEVEDAQSNGVTQQIPERRRPPLQESAYGESARPRRSETSRPRTTAETRLGVSDQDQRPSTPGTPQSPGAIELPGSTPTMTPAEEKAEPLAVPGATTGGDLNGNDSPANTETEQPTEASSEQSSSFRPGLGPMMGKKGVAEKFRKIANAQKAFTPRAGGAGERLAKTKDATGEPDGITGVVPARSAARKPSQDDSRPQSSEATNRAEKRFSPPQLEIPASREQADASSADQSKDQPVPKTLEDSAPTDGTSAEMPRPLAVQKTTKPSESRPRSVQKPKRLPNPFVGAFSNLGVDASLAGEERALNFEDHLTRFGWERNFLQRKKFDTMQTSMRKEVGKIEAGTWLGPSDHRDIRVDEFEKSLDKAIEAVDEMDGLLTLYSVELSTLVDDVTYIEAQSQGLQVQTANQKLLQHELEALVNTVNIDTSRLEPLRSASLSDYRGLEAIEGALSLLYRALQKIDPASIHRSNPSQFASSTPGQDMRALQERKEQYMSETNTFLHRFKLHLDPTFNSALGKARDALQRSSVSSRNNPSAHDTGRAELWTYSPLMLFVKELSPYTWKDVLKLYRDRARNIYQDETRDNIAEWKKRSRKIGAEDNDILFTSHEKEVEDTGLASTAVRKMTIKRSGTLARSLRQASHKERPGSNMSKASDANQLPCEVFAGVLADSIPTISSEQNFVTDFFHASGLENMDFVDAVNLERPSSRHGTDLHARRMHDPDRSMADTVRQTVEAIFAAWAIETQALLEWALFQHQLQGIGILYTLERARLDLADSNQEYLLKVLSQQYSWLLSKFTPFIDAQLAAIENTKIKTSKRTGVMAFVRIFPAFLTTIEGMLVAPDTNSLVDAASLNTNTASTPSGAATHAPETRQTVNDAYTRLTSAIFRALDSIAKDSSSSATAASTNGMAAGADPEDKEKLNAEILLIENTFHLTTELSSDPTLLRNPVLEACRAKAETSLRTHRARYLNAVIRRPLGRLLDFLEGVEADRSKSGQATYSRSAFKKVLSSYDSKSVRRDIEQLKRRVEKHFAPAEGEEGQGQGHGQGHGQGLGQGHARLVGEVLGECEGVFEQVLERAERVGREVYGGEVEVGWGKGDVSGAFRR